MNRERDEALAMAALARGDRQDAEKRAAVALERGDRAEFDRITAKIAGLHGCLERLDALRAGLRKEHREKVTQAAVKKFSAGLWKLHQEARAVGGASHGGYPDMLRLAHDVAGTRESIAIAKRAPGSTAGKQSYGKIHEKARQLALAFEEATRAVS